MRSCIKRRTQKASVFKFARNFYIFFNIVCTWPFDLLQSVLIKKFNKTQLISKVPLLITCVCPVCQAISHLIKCSIRLLLPAASIWQLKTGKQSVPSDSGRNTNSLPTWFEDWEEKEEWLTDLINDGGVCRTAPATPGLLII